jgi:hypothetical protein
VKAAGAEVPILWRGRRAKAFVPTRLAERASGEEKARAYEVYGYAFVAVKPD